jgi:hypothetical protein
MTYGPTMPFGRRTMTRADAATSMGTSSYARRADFVASADSVEAGAPLPPIGECAAMVWGP